LVLVRLVTWFFVLPSLSFARLYPSRSHRAEAADRSMLRSPRTNREMRLR